MGCNVLNTAWCFWKRNVCPIHSNITLFVQCLPIAYPQSKFDHCVIWMHIYTGQEKAENKNNETNTFIWRLQEKNRSWRKLRTGLYIKIYMWNFGSHILKTFSLCIREVTSEYQQPMQSPYPRFLFVRRYTSLLQTTEQGISSFKTIPSELVVHFPTKDCLYKLRQPH